MLTRARPQKPLVIFKKSTYVEVWTLALIVPFYPNHTFVQPFTEIVRISVVRLCCRCKILDTMLSRISVSLSCYVCEFFLVLGLCDSTDSSAAITFVSRVGEPRRACLAQRVI